MTTSKLLDIYHIYAYLNARKYCSSDDLSSITILTNYLFFDLSDDTNNITHKYIQELISEVTFLVIIFLFI